MSIQFDHDHAMDMLNKITSTENVNLDKIGMNSIRDQCHLGWLVYKGFVDMPHGPMRELAVKLGRQMEESDIGELEVASRFRKRLTILEYGCLLLAVAFLIHMFISH